MTAEARPGRHLAPDPWAQSSGPRGVAMLATEDDFELGQAFVEVFVRAGERLLGFFAGCILVAGIWVLWAAL